MFPLVSWDRCENTEANAALVEWGHFLGACERPFALQSFALRLAGQLVAVAVSASTVNAKCGGFARQDAVELARLCVRPAHHDLTRVAIRLWRATAPAAWARLWPVKVLVSYANAARHSGEIYRNDGWIRVADVEGGTAGGGWQRGKKYEAKSVWAWPLDAVEREELRRRKHLETTSERPHAGHAAPIHARNELP